ncbi:Beta-fructofuranosidase, insoluble isoenzyme 1 [Glycine soja]|nr:Beta-fructofuranosidase, insoluble isoenzyme 1 [Glycine max]
MLRARIIIVAICGGSARTLPFRASIETLAVILAIGTELPRPILLLITKLPILILPLALGVTAITVARIHNQLPKSKNIPRQVWLHKSGKWLMQWPNEEVEKLRDKQVSIMREKLVGESTIEVSGIPASQMNRSIIESLREKGRICITSRVYPSFVIDKDAHLYVFYNGSQSVVISELNAWSMKQAKFGQEESIVKL